MSWVIKRRNSWKSSILLPFEAVGAGGVTVFQHFHCQGKAGALCEEVLVFESRVLCAGKTRTLLNRWITRCRVQRFEPLVCLYQRWSGCRGARQTFFVGWWVNGGTASPFTKALSVSCRCRGYHAAEMIPVLTPTRKMVLLSLYPPESSLFKPNVDSSDFFNRCALFRERVFSLLFSTSNVSVTSPLACFRL